MTQSADGRLNLSALATFPARARTSLWVPQTRSKIIPNGPLLQSTCSHRRVSSDPLLSTSQTRPRMACLTRTKDAHYQFGRSSNSREGSASMCRGRELMRCRSASRKGMELARHWVSASKTLDAAQKLRRRHSTTSKQNPEKRELDHPPPRACLAWRSGNEHTLLVHDNGKGPQVAALGRRTRPNNDGNPERVSHAGQCTIGRL